MAINKVIYGGNTLIDLTGDTVAADKILFGYTAHDKAGDAITGTCDYDVNSTDATATTSEILSGKTAYARGVKLIGSMPNNGAVDGTITAKAQEVAIAQGYHDGSGKVAINATEQNKIVATNIKSGVSILGVVGTYTGSELIKATSLSATPYTTAQTVLPSDKGDYDYFTQVDIAAIAYVETANAAGGTTVTIGTVAPA